MVGQDGLGYVFEQRDNTGAAVYNEPTLQMGQTPFDVLAARQYQEQRVQEQRDYVAKQQADKERKALDMQLADIDLSKFPQANQQELAQDITQYKNDLVQYKVKGQDPTDPLQPAWKEAQNKKLALENKILEANKQGALIDEAMKALKADLDSKDPQLDTEKSAANIRAYYSAPNIEARRAIDPTTLLVRKAKVYDIQTPIKGLDIKDFTGSYEVDNPTSGRKGNYLRKKELRSTIEANIDNPINADQVADALVKGDFKTKKEYADYLFEQASNRFSPKSSKTEKGDNGGFGGGGGLSEEQVTAIVNTPATQMNISETDVDGAVRKDAKGVSVSSKTTLYNPQSVGDLKIVVPSAAAYEIKKGKRGATSRNYTLKDGTLGVVLTYADGRPIHDLSGNENVYVFKNKDGKTVKLNEKDAITQGYLKYSTVIQGDGEYIDAGGDKKYEPIIVDANEYINTVNGKSSLPLNDAFNKLTVLNKVAEKKNGGATTAAKKEIKQSDIATKASAAGYTVKEYTDLLKKNGVTIIP